MALTDRLSGAEASRAVKAPCYVASTGNLTLSSSQTIDGILAFSGARVLVKDQTDTAENGIYLVDSSSWTRAKDFDKARDVMPGTLCYVDRGTLYGGSYWVLNSSATSTSISIGTAALTFSRVNNNLSGVSSFGSALISAANASSGRSILGVGVAGDALFTSTSSAMARAAIGALGSSLSTGSIYLGSAGTAVELAIGTSGQVLTSTGGTAAWLTPSASTAATAADQEAGTSTDAFLTPSVAHRHQSAAKAWCKGGQDSTSFAAYNVSSITDVGTGHVRVNLTTPFSSSHWVAMACSFNATDIARFVNICLQASTKTDIVLMAENGVAADSTGFMFIGYGDL